MDPEKQISVVETYTHVRPKYERFTQRLDGLIRELLEAQRIDFHVIESRTKDIASFKEKIARANKGYQDSLSEITDLSALRIITYYQDEADAIGKLLYSEFTVDKTNSVQHAASGSEFGYRSAHYVLELSRNRAELAEWAAFDSMRAEIQVRTVLQHAWAAISHKLQYKREEDVPTTLQRKLFRLSALFELADDEFISLRETSATVSTEIRKQFDEGNLQLPLDSVSVSKLIASSVTVAEISAAAAEAGFDCMSEENAIDDSDNSSGVSDLIQLAKVAGLETAEQLENAFRTFVDKQATFFTKLIELNRARDIDRWAISPPFMCQLALICLFVSRFRVVHLIQANYQRTVASLVLQAAKEFHGQPAKIRPKNRNKSNKVLITP
jgi:putative GTP pyrophosphokinase